MSEKLHEKPKLPEKGQPQPDPSLEGKPDSAPVEPKSESLKPASPSPIGKRAMQGEVHKAQQEWDSSRELIKDEFEILDDKAQNISPGTVDTYLNNKSDVLQKELAPTASVLLQAEKEHHPGEEEVFNALDRRYKDDNYRKYQALQAGKEFPVDKVLDKKQSAFQWLRPGQESPWYTFDEYSSPEEAKDKLDLPLTPKFVRKIDLPAGTEILESKAKGGVFEGNQGGGNQFILIQKPGTEVQS